MYFQKDYVLRMIEMVGELGRRVMSLVRDADAHAQLNEVSERACGLPFRMLENGDPAMLIDLLDPPQRYLAAELLWIAIEFRRRTQTEDALAPLYNQALLQYASLHDAPDYLRPACDRASVILREALSHLTPDSLLCASRLLEAGGQYACAEDALYAAAQADAARAADLLAFYDRLDALDDASLWAGGLSRSEVAEGRLPW